MVGLVGFVVCALAVARLTGLAVDDELTRPIREKVGARLKLDEGKHPQLHYLMTCPWCTSMYVAAAAAPLAYWFGQTPWVLIPATAFAFSQVTGMLSRLGRA